MRHVRLGLALLVAAASASAAPLASQSPLGTYADGVVLRYARTAPQLSYTVTVRPDDRSAYLVELRVTNAPNPATFVIPLWAPGAYRPMNPGANLSGFTAATTAGAGLPVTRASDISWQVDTRGAREIVIRYAAALADTQAWAAPNNRWFLRRTSGLIDGPRTFVYLDGWKLVPARVAFHLPPGWGIGTGLVATEDPAVFWAPSYDVLIDSPVLVGSFATHRFTAAGVPHRAVVDLGGAAPTYDTTAFSTMLRRICETAIGIFGNAPYPDYTFIYAGAGGGLEHLNSTTIGFPGAAVARDPGVLAPVTAHEFFHAWNVKRIRPVELGPFDYTRPVRTVNLWWSEGVTDYYADLILLRAGLDSLPGFARSMAASITSHRRNPGRRTVSPERSSWTVWDPPAANGGLNISYYLQGQLLGWLLDLTIRDSTDNARSLDDVMRYLFDHYAGERGFTREDLRTSVRAATGLDLTSFFAQFVSGTEEIPWNDFLAAAGWRVSFDSASAVDVRIGAISPAIQGGRPRLIVLPGSAAARAGLVSGDEPTTDLFSALRVLTPGQTATLMVMRDGGPVTVQFRAGTYTEITARIADLPTLTEKMRRIRAGLAGR